MATYLLIIIYVIFISLGLPDSVIGSIWPSIASTFNIDVDFQGFVTITISLFTILSTFLTIKLVQIIKEKYIVIFSILLTSIGLLCFGLSNNFILLVLSCVPLGLGAGAIDSILNSYVANHYKAIHMNFLHAFWGVGTIVSPIVLSLYLKDNETSWRIGLYFLSALQFIIFLFSFINIKVWDKVEKNFLTRENKEEEHIKVGFFKTFKIKGVVFAIFAFFAYVAIESICSYWFSSYVTYGLNNKIQVSPSTIAIWTSLFFIGITLGRLIGGLISFKINDKNRMRLGELTILIGIILLSTTAIDGVDNVTYLNVILPLSFIVIGIGCGPIYPAIIHDTPTRFSKSLSQNVISVQMGCSYIANISAAPLFGVLGKNVSFLYLPLVVFIFLIILSIGNEIVAHKTKNKDNLIK